MKQQTLPMNSWTCLATFNQPTPAEKLIDLLRKQNIPAMLHDERNVQRAWFLAKPKAGVHVIVPKERYEQSKEYLDNRMRSPEVQNKVIHCPLCESSRVQYPAMTRKNVLPALVAQVLVLVRLMEHEYYCEDCHHTWTRNARLRPVATQAKA